jgi:UDP-GlcNAc:undecaprenyl-phosphate/decaprenyl-phosphate GlcNAc-1-phosphate transferase
MIVTTIIAFLLSLIAGLCLTPVVKILARKRDWVDLPDPRKVHLRPIPRIGGVAIYLAFLAGLVVLPVHATMAGVDVPELRQIIGLLAGGTLVFALGLRDDIRGLKVWIKFLVQALGASVAFFGGIAIEGIRLPWIGLIQFGLFSLPVTILWFLLVTNAINLIDGLDGLAAGVCFFSAAVLLVLGLFDHRLVVSIGLAALGGATLGFLRYNFNPASIFMGDSGSYFLGFTVAALSILGSMKSQASVTILIPILAIGLPLMDTLWSAIRRFITGQAVFRADRDHVHHRLLKLGYTHRRAVLLLYGIAIVMGAASLLMVQASDRQASLILLGLAVGMGFIFRRLGYVDYLTTEKILGWFRDVIDVVGVESTRRSFLGLQMGLAESVSVAELWANLIGAAQHLGMDYVSLEVVGHDGTRRMYFKADPAHPEEKDVAFTAIDPRQTLRISFPLCDGARSLGYVYLGKDLSQGKLEYHILRRVEHLRRTLCHALARISVHSGLPLTALESRRLTAEATLLEMEELLSEPLPQLNPLRVRSSSGDEDGVPVPRAEEAVPAVSADPADDAHRLARL